jgi:hypothetical protein
VRFPRECDVNQPKLYYLVSGASALTLTFTTACLCLGCRYVATIAKYFKGRSEGFNHIVTSTRLLIVNVLTGPPARRKCRANTRVDSGGFSGIALVQLAYLNARAAAARG